MGAKDRPDLFVVARFLDHLAKAGPCSRSRLQRAVGLNYDIFRRYLELLAQRGHLEVTEESIRMTDEGRRLHAELLDWLRKFFGAVS